MLKSYKIYDLEFFFFILLLRTMNLVVCIFNKVYIEWRRVLAWERLISLPLWESKNLPAFAGQTYFKNIIIICAICTITTYNIFMITAPNIFKFYFKHIENINVFFFSNLLFLSIETPKNRLLLSIFRELLNS
jgi:hypothetical protein